MKFQLIPLFKKKNVSENVIHVILSMYPTQVTNLYNVDPLDDTLFRRVFPLYQNGLTESPLPYLLDTSVFVHDETLFSTLYAVSCGLHQQICEDMDNISI